MHLRASTRSELRATAKRRLAACWKTRGSCVIEGRSKRQYREREHGCESKNERDLLNSCGDLWTADPSRTGFAICGMFPLSRLNRKASPGRCGRRDFGLWGQPASTRSCRGRAWSTITSSIAIATSPFREWEADRVRATGGNGGGVFTLGYWRAFHGGLQWQLADAPESDGLAARGA